METTLLMTCNKIKYDCKVETEDSEKDKFSIQQEEGEKRQE